MSKVIGEVWKPIPNYEGFYEVSNIARSNGWLVSNIRRCCKNENATAYGFMFKEVSICVPV